MAQPVIQTQELTKSYSNVSALQSLNLLVPQHAIFGFLGPNGPGKTTTMKLLLGLIRPTSGSGTAAWVLSKPVACPAYLLAKLLPNLLAMAIIILIVPGIVGYFLFQTYDPTAVTLRSYPIAAPMLISTAAWSTIFIIVAVWQFNRLEF